MQRPLPLLPARSRGLKVAFGFTTRGSSSSSMCLAGLQGLSDCEGTCCILPQLSSPDGPHICLPKFGHQTLSAPHGSIRAGDAAASQEH